MTEITVRPLKLPSSPFERGIEGEQFRDAARLVDDSNAAVFGSGNQSVTVETLFAALKGTSAERAEALSAYVGEEMVGHAQLFMPIEESTDVVDTVLYVHPRVQGEQRFEVFEELAEACIDFAKLHGRTRVFGGGEGVRDGDITAATGYGGVNRGDPESEAWIRRGATLSQLYRYSRLDLAAVDDIDARLAETERRSQGYRVITWEGETPQPYREDMRTLHERMSTDSPHGDLDFEPETWSDERLTEFEWFKMGTTRRMFAAAVQHVASGKLVGYTQLVIASDPAARQHNLIVLKEHRGHRLGELLKLAGIEQLRREVPHADRITTMNAEENQHMLRVNASVGFVPVTWTAVWQLRLSA